MHHLQQAELKVKPLLLAIAKLIVSTQNNVKEARQVFLRK